MGLPTAEHRLALQEQKQRRKAAARANRAAPPYPVRFRRLDGTSLLGMQSRTCIGVVYEVQQDAPGVWRCACPGFAWRGRCSHAEAAAALLGCVA